jgi:hypothetical protein
MRRKYKKIYKAIEYAREHGIDPTSPSTWDNNYRRRQQELAGIIPKIEEEIRNIKKGIKRNKKYK